MDKDFAQQIETYAEMTALVSMLRYTAAAVQRSATNMPMMPDKEIQESLPVRLDKLVDELDNIATILRYSYDQLCEEKGID